MKKRKSPLMSAFFLQRHRFALFFFLFLVVYHVVVVNRFQIWKIDDIAYSFYAVDYSFGFATKLLPGAIYNGLFGKHGSELIANVFETALILLFFFGLSVLLEKLLKRVDLTQRTPALSLLLLYLTGAYTFSIFTKTLAMLDAYWLYFSLAFFLFLEHKWLRFLIPALYLASILVHYSAILNYIVLFSILLLYRLSIESDKKEKKCLIAVFAISMAVSAAAAIFFLLNESKLICSIDEFHEKMNARGSDYYLYYDYAFFDIFEGKSFIPDSVKAMSPSFLKMIYTVYYRFIFNLSLSKEIGFFVPLAFFGGLTFLSPILYFFFKIYRSLMTQAKQKLKRFVYFLMIVQFPFTLFVGMIFSVDANRWMTHAFLISFTMLLALMFYDEDTRTLVLKRFQAFSEPSYSKIYFLAYATFGLLPYF